jgi:phosphatidylinositol-3-phosphatase
VPLILNSTAYRSGGVLFITWDEAAAGDGPIPLIVLSPYAKGNHYSNSTYYTHGSTLRTIQEIFGVYPLIRNAGSSTDLRAMFSVFP